MNPLEGNRRPRSTTLQIVMKGYRADVPRQDLVEKNGLTSEQVSSAIAGLIRNGHIPEEDRGRFDQWRRNSRMVGNRLYSQTVVYRIASSEGNGGVLGICSPFFLRQFFTDEIVEITGINKKIILDARMSAKGLGVEKITTEMRKAIQRRNHPIGGVREYSLDERNAFRFAKALLDANLIPFPEDPDPKASLKDWDELHDLFRIPGSPPLPENNADRLRLEVFYIGMNTLLEKGREEGGGVLTDYVRLGREIDEKWFRNSLLPEQKFISDVLRREWALRRAAERRNGNQGRWEEPFLGGNDEAARAAMRENQRPKRPWLDGDKALRERVLIYGQDGRGSDPRR